MYVLTLTGIREGKIMYVDICCRNVFVCVCVWLCVYYQWDIHILVGFGKVLSFDLS